MITVKKYYQDRFNQEENSDRHIVWKTLCGVWLQKYIKKTDCVIDFGAGYCEFLNNINCAEKIAVDINPDTKKRAKNKIVVLQTDVLSISSKWNNRVNVVFISNFLEHLQTKEEVIRVLEKAYKLLKKEGKVIILQPNIDLVKQSYWNFIDHSIALNSKSLTEALKITGFQIIEFIERFLPYTSKSRLPKVSFLIKLYLKLPSWIRPFAGQSFVVAIKK